MRNFTMDIMAANGTPFRVLAIPASEQGPNPFRVPAERESATVEFYDLRYDFEPNLGQFTGGYYDLRSLLGHEGGYSNGPIGRGGRGLNLDSGQPDWSVDAASCRVIHDWLMLLHERGALA